MPSTRNLNTPSRRSSNRKASDTSPKNQSIKQKASKSNNSTISKSFTNISTGISKDAKCISSASGNVNSSKSCGSISSSILKVVKQGADKASTVTSRRRRSENSDVERSVPVKRSKRSDGDTHVTSTKLCTPQNEDISGSRVDNMNAFKNVNAKFASNDSLRGAKKNSVESSVDETRVSTESSRKNDNGKTIPTSVEPETSKCKKRGRPPKTEGMKESSSADETPDGKLTKQVEAKNTNSSELQSEDISVDMKSPLVGFSPRRSGRAVVPNRRYLETSDHTDKNKTKIGPGSRKIMQKNKTSPNPSNKSHVSRIKYSGEKPKTEDFEHVSVPKSSVTTGINKQNITQVVQDKTTGNVGTIHFSKNKLHDTRKNTDISICSLNFKRTSEEMSSKETVPISSSDVTEPSDFAIEKSLTAVINLNKKIVDAEHISENDIDNKISDAKNYFSKLEVISDSSLPTSVMTEDGLSTVSKVVGTVSTINRGSKNVQSKSQNVIKDKVGSSQTCVVVSKDADTTMIDTSNSVDTSTSTNTCSQSVAQTNEENNGDTRPSSMAAMIPSPTSTCNREYNSQSMTQTSVYNEDKTDDVRPTISSKAAMISSSTSTCSGQNNSQSMAQISVVNEDQKTDVRPSVPKPVVTAKMPVVHVRAASTSRPPPEVQTQTIYKVNLDGTSTRTVIILDQEDCSSVKWKSLLKSPSSKSSTELQKDFVQRKEKELTRGPQSDTVSSLPTVTTTSVVKELTVERSRIVPSCSQSSTSGNQAVPVTPGKIQKATTRLDIPDVSDNLTPFIKVISNQSDGQQTEMSKATSVNSARIVEQSFTSVGQDPRVFTMDARTKRAVASILSLESGITFSSPSNAEETANSNCQETDVMTESVDACTNESVVLPISQTSSSETLTVQSFGDETIKPLSGESSHMSMTTEASNKPASDGANLTDEMDQVNNSDFTALWSDILETNAVTSGNISDAGSSDQSKSKYVTSSTQTPIEPAEEKIIIPSVYKSSVIDVSHIKRECEEEEGEDSPNKQTLVVVQLPEGAVVTRPVVQTRYKYDDAPFLDENYVDIFRCKICCYETKKKANWYKHKQKHLGLRPHACNQCQYRAATASNLKRHLAIHADIRNFMCQLCGMYFRQKIHLERHIKYKHEVKQVKCPLCDYVCANENPDLKVHIKRKHFTGELMESSMKAFTCPECNLIALSKKDLRQHMKFHKQGPELKLFCEYCSFVTDCDSRLRRHMFIHTKEKPFQCGMCEYRGSQKEHVLRHMRNVHNVEIHRRQRKQSTNNQLIEGGQISMAALSKLIDRNDYTCRDKIFACNHCSMKFSKLLNLYKHLYTQHESIMPPQKDDEFHCVVCEFQTNTKKNLLVHMRKHNTHDHNPPSHVYSCVLCRYQNPKRRNLFQHMKKKHHIEIVMKEDGTTSCFIEDSSTLPDDLDQNLMTVGDIVTTTTTHFDSEGDESEYRNVISIQNFASMVAPQPTAINDGEGNLIIDTEISSIQDVQTTHTDAAEAIEGLQALAQQTRVSGGVEVVEGEEQLITLPDPPCAVKTESTDGDDFQQDDKQSIQLTADQLVNLSSGDYVEINGEVYKVEISAEQKQQAISAENIELEEVTCVD